MRAPVGAVRTSSTASQTSASPRKRVLMVAFHFPPLAGSSGIQRTLRFAQHLPALGWQPIVLTAHPRAYEATSDDLAAEIPREAIVSRAFALDASRHLAIRGRYPGFAARPDRWVSWWLGAVPEGLRLIRRHRPDVIWSTYPIATAHAIGATLARRSGLPWIADFRDPMAQEGYPADPLTWRRFAEIEARAIREAALSVFAAPGAARTYRERYPDVAEDRLRVIPNGYDEETFAAAELGLAARRPLVAGRADAASQRHRLSVGTRPDRSSYRAPPSARSRRDRSRRRADPVSGAGARAYLARLIAEQRLESLVEIAPSIPYREAIEEMLLADALLVLQASNCNDQVPAKLYEYARAGRPILALTDPAGDTAAAARAFGLDAIAPLDSVEEIERALPVFLDAVKRGAARFPDPRAVAAASRRARVAGAARAARGGLEPLTRPAARVVTWTLHPATSLERFADAWDRVNDARGGVPFLRAVFIRQLLKEFASGDELLAVYGDGSSAAAFAVLSPKGMGVWQTYQPSQLPLGAWVARPGLDLGQRLAELLRALPRVGTMIGLSQQDPALRRSSDG